MSCKFSHSRWTKFRRAGQERLIITQTDLLIHDRDAQHNAYDGLIYIMYIEHDRELIPLYIGKTETTGRNGGNLSANIKDLNRDKTKFGRWGDNYAYHIGDLSAVVLPGHPPEKSTDKYRSWASALFESYPTSQPKLKSEVLFWTKAWKSSDNGIWEEFGPTRLTFLEYLLIGVAGAAYPDSLLNREGKNRPR